MRFKITHETEYIFSKPVFIEPHYLIFKPKNTPHFNLESHTLQLVANLAGTSEQLDAEDNQVLFCWFNGMQKKINIVAVSIIESTEYNPFNFLVYPLYFNVVPFTYERSTLPLLNRYLSYETIDQSLLQYGNTILASKNNDSISFLSELTIRIHADFVVESREEGVPFTPDKTFQLKKGSCRDLVWMQIHLLRNLGFASRFVSGYYYVAVENPKYELHAWTEVYLPGAGWIGFDPSNGVTTGHTHIAVASSAHYLNTMPVSGTIRGDAKSELKTTLSIEILD